MNANNVLALDHKDLDFSSKAFYLTVNNNQLLKIVEKNQGYPTFLKSLVLFYIKAGKLKNIIYLHQNGYIKVPSPLVRAILKDAAFYNQWKIIRYFHQHGININSKFFKKILMESVAKNNIEIIKYFHQQGGIFTNDIVSELANLSATYGSLSCLKYLCENGLLYLEEDHIWVPLLKAVQHKNLHIFIYFYQNAPLNKYYIYKAIINDYRDMVECFHQQGFLFTNELVLQLASLCVTYGSLACLKFLYEKNLLTLQNTDILKSLLKEALCNNNLMVFNYLYKKSIEFSDEIPKYFSEVFNIQLDNVLQNVHQNYVKIPQRMEYNQFLKYILNQYDHNIKHSENLQYIVKIEDFETFKTSLCVLNDNNIQNLEELLVLQKDIELYYYIAISNGHIYVFQRLRKFFSFLLTEQRIVQEAFELALVNNRKDILSFFLHTDELLLCNKKTIKKCAESAIKFCNTSTIDIFIRYCENIGIDITQRLLYYAAINNRLDIIRYLNGSKGVSLEIFLKINTINLPEGPVRGFLSDRRCLNELKGDLTLIEKMKADVLKDEKVFHPSHFWDFFNEINVTLLKESGFKNFKRNVNQNYFNFIPVLFNDLFLISILFLKIFRYIKSSGKYKLIDPDVINSEGDLKEAYRHVFQKNRKLKLFLYKFTIGGLWDYVKARDPEGLLQKLEEPRVGNPIEIICGKKLISQDLANSVQEYYFLKPFITKVSSTSLRIVEIGAGYGRLGYVLLNALNCKYIIFDISPALYVAQKYLKEVFPHKKIFTFRSINSFEEIKEELEQSDIAFFTINQIKFFPENYSNICINVSSLHEMTREQSKVISQYMSKITKDYIYIKQYKKYKNPYDKIIVKEKDYKFPIPWERIRRRTTPTNIRFFETIFQKNWNV